MTVNSNNTSHEDGIPFRMLREISFVERSIRHDECRVWLEWHNPRQPMRHYRRNQCYAFSHYLWDNDMNLLAELLSRRSYLNRDIVE